MDYSCFIIHYVSGSNVANLKKIAKLARSSSIFIRIFFVVSDNVYRSSSCLIGREKGCHEGASMSIVK